VVDLPEDQHRASKNAITFTDTENNFDIFDWSWGAPPPLPERAIQSGAGAAGPTGTQLNLHLRPSGRGEYGAYNFGRPHAASLYGGSTPSRQSVEGDTSHLDSHEYSGIDLGLIPQPGDNSMDIIQSPGIGRYNSETRSRLGSATIFGRGSKEPSIGPRQDEGLVPYDGDGLDLFMEDVNPMPELDPRSRRECE
jgi:cohesin complex subunit SCC1